MVMKQALRAAAEAIRQCRSGLLVTAGAGMGVDSGLPDFRGNEGFWKAYPPIAKLGIEFQEMANPLWFETQPELAWGFYGHRLNLYRNTRPHDGFHVLRRLGQNLKNKSFVFTSNVDGQFQKAGYSNDQINECHGSIHYLQCSGPCHPGIWKADTLDINVDEESLMATSPLPRCSRCHAIARPNILLFGDWHWQTTRNEKQEEAQAEWLHELEAGPIIIECGAGTHVPSVRHFSEIIAKKLRGRLIRINPRETNVPEGHIGIASGALEALQEIENLL